MKIGRNAPCPCGSGKKYKKCCMLKGRGISAGEEPTKSSESSRDDPKNYDNEELHPIVDLAYTFQRMILARKPHIKEYEKLRKLHVEVLGSMMNYYESGKFTPKVIGDYSEQMILSGAKGEFSMIDADFDLETKEGNRAFVDMLVYKAAPTMNCIVEDYINNKRFRNPEKVEFLQSMLDSKTGLFEVTDVERGEGYVHLKEVFCGDTFKITEIGLSSNPTCSDVYLYTRIITHRGISFGSGLNIVFSKSDPFIKDFIKRHKKDYKPLGEFVRFVELYNRYSTDPKKIRTVNKV